MASKKQSYSSAFTIVELLVVIVVIGILAAITIVSYSGITSKANIASIQSDLTNASTTLKLDQITSNDNFPTTLALANNGKGITPSQTMDSVIYIPDNTSNPKNFCLQYRKGTNTYAVDNSSVPSSGVCLQNLVTNGDFRNGTSGWSIVGSALSALNNILYVTADGTVPESDAGGNIQGFIAGHIYYLRAKAKATSSACNRLRLWTPNGQIDVNNPIINTVYDLSIRAILNSWSMWITHNYTDAATANGKVMQVQYASTVDLTAAFGSGNEPTQAQMDTIMSNYPNSWFNITAKASL